MRRTILAYLAPLTVIAACGGDDGGGGAAPGAKLEPQIAELATAVCDTAFRCCARGEVDWFVGPYVDKQNCTDRFVDHASLSSEATIDLYEFLKMKVTVPKDGKTMKAV